MTQLLADLILVVHFAFVAFVVGSLPLIWLGTIAGWGWARNFVFRSLHLAAILFVTAEAVAGIWCPLTLWEDALRGTATDKSFVARWIHTILYYDLPPALFTIAYIIFSALVAVTWWRVPPRRRSRQ